MLPSSLRLHPAETFPSTGSNHMLSTTVSAIMAETGSWEVLEKAAVNRWTEGKLWKRKNGWVGSLLMLTTKSGSPRAAADWLESLSVMTEDVDRRRATGRGAVYIYIYIYLKTKAEMLLIHTNLKWVVFNVLYIFLCNSGLSGIFSVRGSTSSLFSN